MREPLLLPLAGIIAGILAAQALELPIAQTAWPIPVFVALAAIAAWRGVRCLKITCLMLASIFVGSLAEAWHRPGPTPEIDAGSREIVALEGCVVEPSAFSKDREQFTLELEPGARARVTFPLNDAPDESVAAVAPPRLHYGQHVEIEARIRSPRNYRNPGSFDYVQYLARQNIFWTATMNPRGPAPKVFAKPCGSRFWKMVYVLREAALSRIERLYPGDEYTSGMMQAVLLGENSHLEKIWTENFRKTGTIHALVISGTHVAVLVMVLLFLFRLCGISLFSALLLTASAAWLYALVSGFSPPVARAAAGFSLYMVARFLFRKGRTLNLLSTVAIVYLLIDPSVLTDASFQLSFLSAAALGALAIPILDSTTGPYLRGLRGIRRLEMDPHLEPKVAQLRVEVRLTAEAMGMQASALRIRAHAVAWLIAASLRVALFATELALVSAVMQVGLALPMVLYFHRVSFTGLTANVLIVPLLECAVPLGFASIATGSSPLAALAGWPLKFAAKIADWHAAWEPSWRIASPPGSLALGIVALLVLFAVAFRFRKWRAPVFALLAASFVLLLWQPWPAQVTLHELELTAIDVGQGDSLLVVFPQGATMLVDGGGILRYGRKPAASNFDTGEDIVSPYLWSRGIQRLDVIAVTHAHEDHAGGIAAVMANFHPRQIWFGANPSEALLRNAARLAIPALEQKAGVPFEFFGARVEILAPLPGANNPKPGNNDSLVMKIQYQERSFLLTGDIERPVEELLAIQGSLTHADVLKVGHHGSKTSTSEEFLEAVSPSIAVISAGYENSFGHPHRDVLERLSSRKTTILRTDGEGLVTVRTDGHKLFFSNSLWDTASNSLGLTPVSIPFVVKSWREILVH
jgi:competence protein ComEC